jgi:hypothetical protein
MSDKSITKSENIPVAIRVNNEINNEINIEIELLNMRKRWRRYVDDLVINALKHNTETYTLKICTCNMPKKVSSKMLCDSIESIYEIKFSGSDQCNCEQANYIHTCLYFYIL